MLNGQFTFKTNDIVVCKYCKAELKYYRSNSSLMYHLRHKHPFTSKSNTVSSGGCGSSATESSLLANRKPDPVQKTLIEIQELGKPISEIKYDAITNAIVKWIAKNCRPINTVTDEGLQDVIRIAAGNQSYTLPSRTVISSRLDDLYSNEKLKVQQLLDKADHVALTADYWSSLANDSYLGVTGHFIDETWSYHTLALCVSNVEERHFTENCVEHFSFPAEAWNIYHKVSTFSTDNARNVTSAVAKLPFQHMPCIAHTLQLCVNSAIAACSVDTILSKCRKIVGHFKHSPANSTEMKNHQLRLHQQEQSLIQDVVTRWNSTLQMVERLICNKEAILATLSQPDHKHKLTLLTANEWEKLPALKKLLEPCRYATELLGGEKYVSCSMVLPTLCHISRELQVSDDDPPYVLRFKEKFLSELEQRKNGLNVEWLKLATSLDPRFKKLKCLRKEEREITWKNLKQLIDISPEGHAKKCGSPPNKRLRTYDVSSDSEDEPLSSKKTGHALVLQRYIAEPEIDLDRCPLEWWLKHEAIYPALAKVAKKFLSSPASTVPCERLFSVAGNVVSKKRSSLEPGNVNKLVCLQSWLKLDL